MTIDDIDSNDDDDDDHDNQFDDNDDEICLLYWVSFSIFVFACYFQYTFNPYTGAFLYKGDVPDENEEELFSLADIDYSYRGKFHVNRKPPDQTTSVSLNDMLQYAENVFREAGDTKKVILY